MSAVNGATVALEGVNTFLISEVTDAPSKVGALPGFVKVVNVGGAVALVSETV